jgi:AcrR family transcriptional regulator
LKTLLPKGLDRTTVPAVSSSRAVGRPRLHAPDDERALLLDAGFRVLRERGAQAFTVNDLLRVAGMSTRAFYRHFGTKDELLEAMYRRDAVSAAGRIRRRLASADDGLGQVVAWIDEILGLTSSRSRAERVDVLSTLPAPIIAAASQETRDAMSDLITPLEEAIARAAVEGSLLSTDPAADARMVAAVVYDVAGLARPRTPRPARRVTRDALVGFCMRALGAQVPDRA